jgi:ketosteroid isomerase-like protein
MSDTNAVTVEVLRDLLAAFNAHDLDRIMTFFAEDCSFDLPRGAEPFGTRYVGKTQVRAGLASRFAGLPDVHYGDDEHWVCGDNAVSRWLLTGTTRDGRAVEVRGCDLFEFREGKCVRKDSYWKIVEA